MAVRVAILFLVLATPAVVYAAQHVVGGSSGWNIGEDYATWAAGETFTVGDKLVFNYDSSHTVDEVSKADYDNCNTGNAIKSHSGGTTTIDLTKAGSMYFICPTIFHCGQGMKLAVNVQAAGGSPGGSPPPSSTPTTPSTPSAPSPSTPSAPSPSTPSTPSGSTTPSTTPATSSPRTENSPNSPNGATGTFGSINHLMIGFSLVLAALFVRI